MSRSNYSDCSDQWGLICWRGAVASALRGKRGQAFLQELVTTLDAMPVKELIEGKLEVDGEHCALGIVAQARGLDIESIDFPDDPYDLDDYHHERLADALGVADALVREVMFINDEDVWYGPMEPKNAVQEKRWRAVRKWADAHIRRQG